MGMVENEDVTTIAVMMTAVTLLPVHPGIGSIGIEIGRERGQTLLAIETKGGVGNEIAQKILRGMTEDIGTGNPKVGKNRWIPGHSPTLSRAMRTTDATDADTQGPRALQCQRWRLSTEKLRNGSLSSFSSNA